MTALVSHAPAPAVIADGQASFKVLLDDANLVAVVVNQRSQITYCNPCFARLSGWSFKELSGQPWRDVFEESLITRSGECRNIRWNTFALRDAAGRRSALAGIGEDVTEQRKIERAVMDSTARQRGDLERDLHDGLGQDLAGIALLARSLATRAHRDQLRIADELARLSTIASNAIECCRRIAREFSPSSDLQGGLIHALRQLTSLPQDGRSPSAKFVIRQTAPVALSTDASDHVYRIAQEWIADTLQRAAAASILVRLNIHLTSVRLEIVDDGAGIAKPSDMLQHRAALLNAQLLVESRHAGGTRLALMFPQPA